MLERIMASLLMTAVRRLHSWVDLLMALLRWIVPLVLPTLCPWAITRRGLISTPPCSTRTSSTSVSARRVKDGLRVLTYGEVARARQLPCCGSSNGEVETCAVCLGELRRRDTVRVPRNCRHVYHRRCLDRWIDHDEQGTCPLCRAPLLTSTAPSPTPATQSREQEQRCSWAVEQLLYLFGDDLLPPSPSPAA
ncbi:hypothetical protein Taro_044883 [Colocasia esculenta]|uniref:RING-type domain-containing protein n=1 Tax=Colocasia esculenta TaxID=4460 RepID=A0A843WZ50_COLES|nr:hypothetical protein [Colocasia esculenta]